MSNLFKRLLSAAVLVPLVVILIFFASPLVFSLVIAALAGVSSLEYVSMALGRCAGKRLLIAPFLAAVLAFAISLFETFCWAPLLTMVWIVPVAALSHMVGFKEIKDAVWGTVHSVFGAVYAGCLWGIVSLTFSTHDSGRGWIFALVAGCSLGDTGSYAMGRMMGKKKLAPRISPGKTWAGSFGGIIGTTLGVALTRLLLLDTLGWIEVLLLGLFLSIASQTGDLVESFLKRGFGAKDSSKLIPGHGGVLDRCDSLMFGAPVVFLYSILRSHV